MAQVADERTRRERKHRVLSQGTPSITASIADALVIKQRNLFFLSGNDGRVPFDREHGLGLYYNDCRFLNGYDLTVAGSVPHSLVATAPEGFRSIVELTNGDSTLPNGDTLRKESLGIRWEHLVDGDAATLHDRISIRNLTLGEITLPLTLRFRAEFEDITLVRGLLHQEEAPAARDATWQSDTMRFAKVGIDGSRRTLTLRFSVAPVEVSHGVAQFLVRLSPRATTSIAVWIGLTDAASEHANASASLTAMDDLRKTMHQRAEHWLSEHASYRSESLFLNRVVDRALRDLEMLRSRYDDEEYFSAGVPWFATLFGRDSIITALQMLAINPRIAANTARVLAQHQGKKIDPWREEQPGKILHELRVGELTRAGEIPYDPYFGSVDATPLFLILIARYAAWTGDLGLFVELREHVDRALNWIDRYGDQEADGYVEYRSESRDGLINQGWKDSGDAIVDNDGSIAAAPITLVEVQAYIVFAKRVIADLFRRSGDEARATQLENEARTLRDHLNRDFWLEGAGIYAMALTAEKQPTRVVASNAGHVLWAGAADPEKAQQTMQRLLAGDMFSGWGIRTLSQDELRYNPLGYHLGTVWPHDNAMIAHGFRRYGFDDAAQRVISGMLDAAFSFRDLRIPELFAGFSREDFGAPVSYPVANHPQAWGAGSVLAMLDSLLGWEPNAFARQLRIVRPMLPQHVDTLEVSGVVVGDARVDLRFARRRDRVDVNVINVDGAVHVEVDYDAPLPPEAADT